MLDYDIISEKEWPTAKCGPFFFERLMRKFLSNNGGATTIEYTVICACILLAFVLGLALVGGNTKNSYTNLSNTVDSNM